jgi:uncharacterized membrane protein
MVVLDIVLRWAHLIGAILLVGGIAYQWLVVGKGNIPTTADPAAAANNPQRRRWSIVVMAAITLLLVSGLINAALVSIRFELGPLYNSLLGVKLILGLIVFFLASVLSGRSALAQRLRASPKPWLMWLAVLSLVVVMLGSVMKNLEHAEKQRSGQSETVESSSIP